MPNIQLLLLAAGASKRMGEPKQLLQWGNQTLIEHQLHNLLETNHLLSVVIGSYSKVIIELMNKLPIDIYNNKNWVNGMGTSIAYGVKKLLEKDPMVDGILISLIDQPLLTTDHFNKMIELFEPEKKQIIVSHSKNGWSGAPVLFDKVYFEELIQLKGDEGAKVVTSKYRNLVQLIDGGNMLRDIDTPETYRQVLAEYIRTN